MLFLGKQSYVALQCYKHVAALLLRAFNKARKSSKLHVLYALSSIVRKSRAALGSKDPYGEAHVVHSLVSASAVGRLELLLVFQPESGV